MVIFQGKQYKSKKLLSENFGVKYGTFKSRRRLGWSVEQALGLEKKEWVRRGYRVINVDGTSFSSISHAARHYGLAENLCRDRIDLGWPVAEVFGLIAKTNRKPYRKSITINSKLHASLRLASKAVNEPFTTFLNNVVDGQYIKPDKRQKKIRLAGNARPFIFAGYVYPSVRYMLNTCGASYQRISYVDKGLKHYLSQAYPQQKNVAEIAKVFGKNKPKFVCEFDAFIAEVDQSENLSNHLFDATNYLSPKIAKDEFYRDKYLAFFGML